MQAWIAEFGWETILNKRGSTYRQLSDEQKQSLNAGTALQLLVDNPSMIKRPILSNADQTLVGFNAALYQTFIN